MNISVFQHMIFRGISFFLFDCFGGEKSFLIVDIISRIVLVNEKISQRNRVYGVGVCHSIDWIHDNAEVDKEKRDKNI